MDVIRACNAFPRQGWISTRKDLALDYLFQSLAKASAASFRARSFCWRALSVRLRRGLARSRRAAAAVREQLSSLSTTVRAASKIIRGSKLSDFDDVLMSLITSWLTISNNTGDVGVGCRTNPHMLP